MKREHAKKKKGVRLRWVARADKTWLGMSSEWNWGWSTLGRRKVGFECDERMRRGDRVHCVSEWKKGVC